MRRTKPEKREILPDVRYNSTLVTNLISRIMLNGKRSTATSLVYGALDICSEKTGKNGLEAVEKTEYVMQEAVFAVNCVGDIVENGDIIAGARRSNSSGFADSSDLIINAYANEKDFFSGNTVLGCIMTNAQLSKAGATRLSAKGHDAIARTVLPSHSVYDGDTVFSLCSGKVKTSPDAVGILAQKASEQAIYDAVKSAETYRDYLSFKDLKQTTDQIG